MRRRAVVVIVLALALGGAGLVRVSSSPATAGGARLAIAYWAHAGTYPPVTRATLTCAPAGGTVRDPAAACARLAARAALAAFPPPPPGTACTQIAGGPEHAIVSGRLPGDRRVWVHLRQTDGCQIARWQALAFLLPR